MAKIVAPTVGSLVNGVIKDCYQQNDVSFACTKTIVCKIDVTSTCIKTIVGRGDATKLVTAGISSASLGNQN